MRKIQLKYLATMFLLCTIHNRSFGQILNQPENACPDWFEYVCLGGDCFGKLTLPNISYGRTTVQVEFSQLTPVISGYYGSLTNMDDSDTVLSQIASHAPVAYRVNFAVRNELPKLTKIAVNGVVICAASAYPAPSTHINLNIVNFSEIIYTTFAENYNNKQQKRILPFEANVQPGNGYSFNRPSNRELQSRRTQFEVPLFRNSESPTEADETNVAIPSGPTQSDIFWTPTKSTQPRPISQFDLDQIFKTLSNNQMPSSRIPSENPSTPTGESIPISKAHPDDFSLINPFPSGRFPTDEPKPQQQGPSQSFLQQNIADICGIENDKAAIVPFITGGIFLRRAQFPWLTAIYHRTVLGTSFICGGSLISMRTVLTAAHCFILTQLKADSIAVALGRHDISKTNEVGAQARDIKTLITNPEYDPDNFPDADIALLIMAEFVSFSEVIKPICLWTNSEDDIINETGYVAGWGGDAFGNTISPVPKMAPATIVSEAVCRRSSDLLKKIVTSRTFCAGEQNGIGPCMGDSGGGLMLKRNERWVLRGVVAAGTTEHARCNLRKFVVYCDVAKYISWVMTNML